MDSYYKRLIAEINSERRKALAQIPHKIKLYDMQMKIGKAWIEGNSYRKFTPDKGKVLPFWIYLYMSPSDTQKDVHFFIEEMEENFNLTFSYAKITDNIIRYDYTSIAMNFSIPEKGRCSIITEEKQVMHYETVTRVICHD